MRERAVWIVRASSAAVRADSLPPFRMAALPMRHAIREMIGFKVYIYISVGEWFKKETKKIGSYSKHVNTYRI